MKTLILSMLVLGTVWANAAQEKLITIATVKVQQGYDQQFKEAANEMVIETRHEQGNVSYNLLQSPTDPTEFATVEVWRSQKDIDEHMTLPHMQKFFSQVGKMFAPGFPILKTYKKEM